MPYKSQAKAAKSETEATHRLNGRQRIPILSFFTGAGFLDLGFRQSGFDSVWHNEFYPPFVEGFEHGMSSLGVSGAEARIQNVGSILDIGPKRILKEAFGASAVPRPFGVIGGPPCPDFSVGGKNRGGEGERGQLSRVYAERIRELKPDFFLFENVPGLIRTAKHREFLSVILASLTQHYLVDAKILRSLDFGVPQDRERIFLVGISFDFLRAHGYRKVTNADPEQIIAQARNGRRSEPPAPPAHWFPWDKHQLFSNAKETFNWPDTSPFGASPPPTCPPGCPPELMVGPSFANVEGLPNSHDCFKPYSKVFKQIAEGDVSRKSSKRLHRWRYSPAAAYGNNEVHLHPWEPRRLTVREALRIQTVPDAYALPPRMTLSAMFKTVGNGVPVKLAQAVSASIFDVLEQINDGTFRPNT
jgi:DNA (cytosine-5)-methyltransferase 1